MHFRAVQELACSGQADRWVMSPLPGRTARWLLVQHAASTRQLVENSLWKISTTHSAGMPAGQGPRRQQGAPFAQHKHGLRGRICQVCLPRQLLDNSGTREHTAQWRSPPTMAPVLELLLDLVEGLMGMVLATGCPLIDTTWRLLRPSPLQQGTQAQPHSNPHCGLICQQVLNAGQLANGASQEQRVHHCQ